MIHMKTYKVIEDGIEYHIEEDINGNKFWYLKSRRSGNKILHRENGPAEEYSKGYKAWFFLGQHHRKNGPAVEHFDGEKQYWLYNKFYNNIKSDDEWIEFQNELIIKEIIE
jgi:hypothetical protein